MMMALKKKNCRDETNSKNTGVQVKLLLFEYATVKSCRYFLKRHRQPRVHPGGEDASKYASRSTVASPRVKEARSFPPSGGGW